MLQIQKETANIYEVGSLPDLCVCENPDPIFLETHEFGILTFLYNF